MITTFTNLAAVGYLNPYASQYSLPAHPLLFVTSGSGSVYERQGGEPFDYLMGATIVTQPASDDPDDYAEPISAPQTVLFDWNEPGGPAD